MEPIAESNLWCHTCRTLFRSKLDNSFSYKCPCGSEFIEEITDRNDPRLFDASNRPVQTPSRSMDSESGFFSQSSSMNVPIHSETVIIQGNRGVPFMNFMSPLGQANLGRQASFGALSEPMPRPAAQVRQPTDNVLYPGFRDFISSINSMFSNLQFAIPGQNPDAPMPCPPHIVNTLPRKQYTTDLASKMTDKDCAICREEFRNEDRIMFLGCKHAFHEDCMMPWLRQHSSCPTCRHRIALNDPSDSEEQVKAMLSSIVFINMRGDVLIYRIYKDDISRTETFHFCTRLIANKNKKETPVLYLDGTTFFYVPYKDFILVAATKTNVNCGMVFQFLYSVLTILKSYFADEPTEALIKAKYVLIYEILDEIIDYGIPQITEPKILQEFITEGGIKLEKLSDFDRLKKITTIMTSATAWRDADIKYQKNQVWIDIIESVNVLLSNKGNVLKADITGSVEFTSQLSGMPECKFAINDKFTLTRNREGEIEKSINIDDLKFDRCVKLSKFDRENAITFTPPDGKFTLMTYRVSSNFTLPFKIMCIYNELSPTKLSYQIKLKSIFDAQFFAQNVVLTIPTPKNVLDVSSNSAKGKAKYEADKKAVMWRIKKFHGQTEVLIRTDIDVSNEGYGNWLKAPLSLEFQVPMTTASGLKVLSLRVTEKNDYSVSKWIRYLTKSGEYCQRI